MNYYLSFDRIYTIKSFVQSKQNLKFLSFITNTLLKNNILNLPTIAEVGVGDINFSLSIANILQPKVLYLIDLSKELLDLTESALLNKLTTTKTKIIKFANNIKTINYQKFNPQPDIIISSNTLHWIPNKPPHFDWLVAIKNIFNIVKDGGYVFIHCGLKDTYKPLYNLANLLFYNLYNKYVDLTNYLYYPTLEEILDNFKSVGYKILHYTTFKETNETAHYSKEELYLSFSNAGLKPFLCEINNNYEKDYFTLLFIKHCKKLLPNIDAFRGFFALRKPFINETNLIFSLIPPKKATNQEYSLIHNFINQINNDFIPPLNIRTPDDETFNLTLPKNKNTTSSTQLHQSLPNQYADYLLQNYYILYVKNKEDNNNNNNILGILAFTLKNQAYSIKTPSSSHKIIYISTIGTNNQFRNLGIGTLLYKHFLNKILPDLLSKENIYAIETRTWSTNIPSKILLKKFDFTRTKIIEHERGENIHTEYYVKYLN